MTIKRIDAGPRMSAAVVHNGVAYLAGQVADDPVPSGGQQTRQSIAKIDKLPKPAGTDKGEARKAKVWPSDTRTFDEMNKEWDAWVSAGNTPARATVEARLATPAYLVEIMVVAAV